MFGTIEAWRQQNSSCWFLVHLCYCGGVHRSTFGLHHQEQIEKSRAELENIGCFIVLELELEFKARAANQKDYDMSHVLRIKKIKSFAFSANVFPITENNQKKQLQFLKL
uniref:Uncharacterized protein n=1 Tax=Lactuca sativa TaxID=4236 RepID=A0A9R1WAH5_LACSA|nr:hypothetical protein LSAT_V11C300101570 [Lactuca sativa]